MRILILGCGWVGEEVAKYYISRGYEVFATCTSEEKKEHLHSLGLRVAVVDFDEEISISEFPSAFDHVLNSIPASSKSSVDEIAHRFENIQKYLSNIRFKKQIYLSSIGIYPDTDGIFDEEFSEDLNERLRIAEQKIFDNTTHIYRLGGLFGKNRIFAKYFANRVCTRGEQPANFIHIDDVVALLVAGFGSKLQANLYNVVAPEHPTKEEVIRASAKKYHLELPLEFKPENSFQKIVDGSKIIEELNYTYKYPSPVTF